MRGVLAVMVCIALMAGVVASPHAAAEDGVSRESSAGREAVSAAQEQPANGDLYFDVCDDADGSPIDLRRTNLAAQSDETAFFVKTCSPWSPQDLGEGHIEWRLGGEPPDYTVRLSQGQDTDLQLAVFNPESSTTQPTFTADVTVDGDTVGGWVPTDRLGEPAEFRFSVHSEDAQGRTDLMPHRRQADEPLLRFPNRCQALTVDRHTVTTRPGGFSRAVEAVRGLGLEIPTALDGARVFTVRAPADLDLGTLSGLPGLDSALSDVDLSAPVDLRSVLQALPGVAAVERPALVQRFQTPTAPRYPDQWSLPLVQAPEGWQTRTGSGLPVAVIDDGIDANRAVFEGRVAAGYDTMFDRPLEAGVSSDRGGHGTAVASVLAADGQAGEAIAGVDWSAELVPYRIFDAAGCATDVEIAQALERAAQRGIAVANLSIGTTRDTQALRRAVTNAIDAGVTVVAAAGNGAQAAHRDVYPAVYEDVIGVGAVTRDRELAHYSNIGTSVVHVVAPGGDGSGTARGGILVLGERGEVVPTSGTSFATPLVAGAAALARAEADAATPETTATLLATSATDLGQEGRDDRFGYGLLDVATLLERSAQVMPTACPAGEVPPSEFADVTGNVHRDRIACLVWYGVARGLTTTAYGPDAPVTRAQMATFVTRTLAEAGHRLPQPTDQGFTDLTGGPHDDAIRQLAELGVVNGTSATTYSPRQVVRRDQMASFLVRAYEEASLALDQPASRRFDDTAGNVHADNIDKAAAAGFAQGTSDDAYAPELPVRRDQMASFLARVLNRFATEGRLTLPS